MKIKYVHRLVSKLLFVFFVIFSQAQNKTLLIDTSEKFIAVGQLTFRDFDINGRLNVYEDYRKPTGQKAQDLLSNMMMLCLIHDAFPAHPRKNGIQFNHLKS